MKIAVLMTSTSYPVHAQDWRGRFIENMVSALAARDDVSLTLWAPPGPATGSVASALCGTDASWLEQLSSQGGIAHLLRTRKIGAAPAVLSLLLRLRRAYRRQDAEIAHVNWLQNAIPLWGTKTPALISVLGTDFALLRLPGMTALLRAVLKQRRCLLAPNAEWMVPGLQSAFGDVAEVRAIPFGVDARWFDVARLPRPGEVPEWLCITRITRNKIGDLFSWGSGLFGTNRRLHLFGPMQEHMDLPPWLEYHGPTFPEELANTWFPRACGLISLSRHDEGRPQVMLEAMASGLPILASRLPAHEAVVQHRHTGWLAESREDVAAGLAWLESAEHNASAGTAARDWVKAYAGTWTDCAARYAEAYRQLLERDTS